MCLCRKEAETTVLSRPWSLMSRSQQSSSPRDLDIFTLIICFPLCDRERWSPLFGAACSCVEEHQTHLVEFSITAHFCSWLPPRLLVLTGAAKCELGGCGLLVHDHRNRSSWSSTGTSVPDSWREAPAQWTLLTQNLAASRGPVRVSWLRNRHPTGIWSIWARNFPWKSTSKVNCQACVHWGGRLLASRVEDSAAYSWQVTLWPLHESMGVLTGLTFNCMVFLEQSRSCGYSVPRPFCVLFRSQLGLCIL